MIKVLDASALLAYLEKTGEYQVVQDLLTEASARHQSLWMTTVNWGEVYYILIQHYGIAEADNVVQLISTLPITLAPADEALARQAAYFKGTKKIPYADCFAAALASMHKATLITADKDFKRLGQTIKIHWL